MLPMNSYPDVHKIVCSFHPNNPYIVETKMKIITRSKQHDGNVEKEQWQKSALALHKKSCYGDIQYTNPTNFDRAKFRGLDANLWGRKFSNLYITCYYSKSYSIGSICFYFNLGIRCQGKELHY